MRTDSTRAVRSLVYATLGFSLMSLFARLAGARIPATEIVFVRSWVTLGLTLALLRQIRLDSWRGKHPKLLVARAVTGFGALCCFYYAVSHLPLAEATVIHFTHPIFTAAVAPIYLGERVTLRLGTAIALGLSGMLLITRPAALFAGQASDLPVAAVLAGLAGAVLSSFGQVLARRLAVSEHELVIVLYLSLVSIPLSLFTAAPVWVWPTVREWLWLAAVGLAAQGAQIYLNRGLKHIQAGSAGVILYLQIVFATFWGLIILGERPDAWTLAGSLLVLGGTFVIARKPSP